VSARLPGVQALHDEQMTMPRESTHSGESGIPHGLTRAAGTLATAAAAILGVRVTAHPQRLHRPTRDRQLSLQLSDSLLRRDELSFSTLDRPGTRSRSISTCKTIIRM
jgi:hypothetical protein